MHNFKTLDDKINIEFKFRKDILNISIYKTFERIFTGIYTYPIKTISVISYYRIMKRLGQLFDLLYPFRLYCFRREDGTELIG